MSGSDEMSVQIVPVAEEHIADYHSAIEIVAREGKYLGRTHAPPLEDARIFTLENIASGNAHFVAVDGGKVVGWCDIVPSKREAFVHCGTLGMGLLPEYRGRGIGIRLLSATLDKAREKGLERVELEVFEPNVRAIQLYRKAGFSIEGTKVHGARLCGECFNVVCMALFLQSGGPWSKTAAPPRQAQA